jgi:hypothetical protein
VSFDGAYDYRLFIRGKDGTPYGPYTVTAGADAKQVVSDSAVSENIVFKSFAEAPLFIFGRSVGFAKDCVITGLRPSDNDSVEVTAVVYDSRVYAYDDEDAPELENPSSLPPDEALPVVSGVEVSLTGGTNYRITWDGAVSAQYYVVQISPDELDVGESGKVWEDLGQTTATAFEASINIDGDFDVRVAAVNVGQGPWAYASGRSLDYLVNPDGIYLVDTDGNRLTN